MQQQSEAVGCSQCDNHNVVLARCPLSSQWFCSDRCLQLYTATHPNAFVLPGTVVVAAVAATTKKAKVLAERKERRHRHRGDHKKHKKHDAKNKKSKKKAASVVLKDTLPADRYIESQAAKHRLRDQRLQWQRERDSVDETINRRRQSQVLAERDSLLQTYAAQIELLRDYVALTQRALSIWQRAGLCGERVEQQEKWLKRDLQCLAKLQSVYDDIAARYDDTRLGVEGATTDEDDDEEPPVLTQRKITARPLYSRVKPKKAYPPLSSTVHQMRRLNLSPTAAAVAVHDADDGEMVF